MNKLSGLESKTGATFLNTAKGINNQTNRPIPYEYNSFTDDISNKIKLNHSIHANRC